MPAWKVLLIGLLSFICFGLAMSTILVSMDQEGSRRWVWMGALLVATLFMSAVLARFLTGAGNALDASPRRGQN